MNRCRHIVGWIWLGLWGVLFPAVGQSLLPAKQELVQEEVVQLALSEEQLMEMTSKMEEFLGELTQL